jgi:hypothetical protein
MTMISRLCPAELLESQARTWCLLELCGGTPVVAHGAHTSGQAVRAWIRIPPNRVALIAELSGVAPEVIRPDLHGHAWPWPVWDRPKPRERRGGRPSGDRWRGSLNAYSRSNVPAGGSDVTTMEAQAQ